MHFACLLASEFRLADTVILVWKRSETHITWMKLSLLTTGPTLVMEYFDIGDLDVKASISLT